MLPFCDSHTIVGQCNCTTISNCTSSSIEPRVKACVTYVIHFDYTIFQRHTSLSEGSNLVSHRVMLFEGYSYLWQSGFQIPSLGTNVHFLQKKIKMRSLSTKALREVKF